MSTLNGLHRRIDTIEKDLANVPSPGEKGILLLPCKDGIDGKPCEAQVHKVVENIHGRTIFYLPGITPEEIEALING
jgi:hypothetical protein